MNRGTFLLGGIVVAIFGAIFGASIFGQKRVEAQREATLQDAWSDFNTCVWNGELESDETSEERLARMYAATKSTTEGSDYGERWPERCTMHGDALRKAARRARGKQRAYTLETVFVPSHIAISGMSSLATLTSARREAAGLGLKMSASPRVRSVSLGPRPLALARLPKVEVSTRRMVLESKHDRVFELAGTRDAPTLCRYGGACTALVPPPDRGRPAGTSSFFDVRRADTRLPTLVPAADNAIVAYRWAPGSRVTDATSGAVIIPDDTDMMLQSAFVHSAHAGDVVTFAKTYRLDRYLDGKKASSTDLSGQTWLFDKWVVEQTNTQPSPPSTVGTFGVRVRPLPAAGAPAEAAGTYELARGLRNWSCDSASVSAFVVEPLRAAGNLEVLARVGSVWTHESVPLPARTTTREFVIHCGRDHIAVLARTSDSQALWLDGLECDGAGCEPRHVSVPACGIGRVPREVAFLGKDAIVTCLGVSGLIVKRGPIAKLGNAPGVLAALTAESSYDVPWLLQDEADVIVFTHPRDSKGGAAIRYGADGEVRPIERLVAGP